MQRVDADAITAGLLLLLVLFSQWGAGVANRVQKFSGCMQLRRRSASVIVQATVCPLRRHDACVFSDSHAEAQDRAEGANDNAHRQGVSISQPDPAEGVAAVRQRAAVPVHPRLQDSI